MQIHRHLKRLLAGLALALLAIASWAQTAAQARVKPNVVVLGTGGTIAGAGASFGNTELSW
jgi:L-asparaginase/Glu-tRNA(Gln) amidotransferase subunit D